MDKMKQSQKVANFIEYLQEGGEVMIGGHTYVWLHNHVTQVIGDTVYGIDGLAIKGVSISNGAESPHYIGRTEMPLCHLLQLVEQITEEQWICITSSLVLQDMKKERS